VRHRVLLDRGPVVRADVDVDAHDLPRPADQLQHRGREHDRAAVCDPGLDDQVRLDVPDDLLQGDQVLRELDDRPAHPAEVV
jgi:hypothetical protein